MSAPTPTPTPMEKSPSAQRGLLEPQSRTWQSILEAWPDEGSVLRAELSRARDEHRLGHHLEAVARLAPFVRQFEARNSVAPGGPAAYAATLTVLARARAALGEKPEAERLFVA